MKYKNTYCNPLPMPDYPQGSEVNGFHNCRELADPTVIWYEEKWYLYATIGSIYVSEDYRTWTVYRSSSFPKLVAPTVVRHRERFYLVGSESPVYEADHPCGPFREVGWIRDEEENVLYLRDPMLFSDDDGRLYLYWGLGPDGIYGMELDREDPCRGITMPVSLLRFEPVHQWERMGAWNQNAEMSFIEGAWMQKHKGRYYLIYAASGTCYRTYALGAYQSDAPLSGFVYQEHNPILQKRYGLVTGPGHGCIVEGPGHTLWAFYTIKMCYATKYERRIAMDPVRFDEKGNIFIEASEVPGWAPGYVQGERADAFRGQSEKTDLPVGPGLLPLTSEEPVAASSAAPGRDALYALDESMLTWWQPEKGDVYSSITIELRGIYQVSAVRIIWRDINLDYDHGILPGPYQYTVEGRCGGEEEEFQMLLDCTQNKTDLAVDYRIFETKEMSCIRFSITGHPPLITPGVINFTVFGRMQRGGRQDDIMDGLIEGTY